MKNPVNKTAMNNMKNKLTNATMVASSVAKNYTLLGAEKSFTYGAKGAFYIGYKLSEMATNTRAKRLGITREEADAYIGNIMTEQAERLERENERKLKIAKLKALRDAEIKKAQEDFKSSVDLVNNDVVVSTEYPSSKEVFTKTNLG